MHFDVVPHTQRNGPRRGLLVRVSSRVTSYESRREDLLLKMLLDENLVGSCPRRVESLGGRVGEMGWSCLELAKADGSSRLGS